MVFQRAVGLQLLPINWPCSGFHVTAARWDHQNDFSSCHCSYWDNLLVGCPVQSSSGIGEISEYKISISSCFVYPSSTIYRKIPAMSGPKTLTVFNQSHNRYEKVAYFLLKSIWWFLQRLLTTKIPFEREHFNNLSRYYNAVHVYCLFCKKDRFNCITQAYYYGVWCRLQFGRSTKK